MSTTTLAPQKEQLALDVTRELEVLNVGSVAFGIGKATKIFRSHADASFDDVFSLLTRQTDETKAIVLSGLIAARFGVAISYLLPTQMQKDLAEEYRSFDITPCDTATMYGRLLVLKTTLADRRKTAEMAAINDGTLAEAKSQALVKSLTNLKSKGVSFTEEEKAAIIAAL